MVHTSYLNAMMLDMAESATVDKSGWLWHVPRRAQRTSVAYFLLAIKGCLLVNPVLEPVRTALKVHALLIQLALTAN